MSTLTTVTPKALSPAKPMKVTKTQAVLASVERFRQRQQAKLDALPDKEKSEETFVTAYEKECEKASVMLISYWNKLLGIKKAYINVRHTEMTEHVLDRGDFHYVDLEVLASHPDMPYDRELQEYGVGGESDPTRVRYTKLPETLQKQLMKIRTLIADYRGVRTARKSITDSLSIDGLNDKRISIKKHMSGTQSLSDLQMVQAILSFDDQCSDIDTMLDAMDTENS